MASWHTIVYNGIIRTGRERIEMKERAAEAGLVVGVIVLSVIFWKLGVPTKWELTQRIFNYLMGH